MRSFRFTDRSQFPGALSFLPFNLCQHQLETSRNINAIQQYNDFQCDFDLHKPPHLPELWTTGSRGNRECSGLPKESYMCIQICMYVYIYIYTCRGDIDRCRESIRGHLQGSTSPWQRMSLAQCEHLNDIT